MADGRRAEMWNHTSHLLATLIKVNLGVKVTPDALNPYCCGELDDDPDMVLRGKELRVLKDIFVRG